MIRQTRWALTAAVAVALATAQTARAAEVDKLIPADAESVLSVNVRQIIDSDLIKKFALEQIKQALKGNDAQQMMQSLGLDPLKDVTRIVAAGSGATPEDMKGLVIIRGSFDPDKLFKAVEVESKKEGSKISLVRDADTVLVKIQGDNQPNPAYATVVDNKTIVAGTSKDIVKDALAVSTGAKKAAPKRELAALVTRMDEKASMFACGVVAGKLGNLPIPGANDPNVKGALGDMENITLTIRVTADVGLEITMGMKDGKAANDFGMMVDQGIQQAKGLLPLVAAQNPQLKPVVELSKTLKSNVKDKDVAITATLSGDAIAKMLNPGD